MTAIFIKSKDPKKGERVQQMEISKINVEDIKTAEYNPRKDLTEDDKEYIKLKNSITTFGYVEPIIWNKRTGNIVGGHQRFKVLVENGAKEVEVVAVDLEYKDEKKLNILLNKVKGRWDIEKLTDLLQELEGRGEVEVTGFEDWELQGLLMQYDHIQDLMDEDFSDFSQEKDRTTFTMTFSCPAEAREAIENYIKNTNNAKEELASVVISKVKGLI